MSEAFIGEIRLFSMAKPPAGWHVCDGTLLNIQANQALYSLLGIHYGGDGKTTFALPDLRGRVPVGVGRSAATGNSYQIGQNGGKESVTLTAANLPQHTHQLNAIEGNGSVAKCDGAYFAEPVTPTPPNPGPTPFIVTPENLYASATNLVALNPAVVGSTGGGAHNNMQPFSVINYCICTTGGYYPPRN